MKGQDLINDYDDRCSSFWGPQGNFLYDQVSKNFVYFIMNLSMSLTYVVFIAAAVPVHLKYMAKICFSSLIFSALEMGWVFSVPFLYELVVGAFFAVVLPIIAKAVLQAVVFVKSNWRRF